MRIPLGIQLDSRDGTLDQDELLINFQQCPDGIYKRGGTSRTSYSATANAGLGIFVLGSTIYMWTGAMTTSPTSSAL